MKTFLDLYTMTRPAGLPPNLVVYMTLLLLCWVYALRRGGAPERLAATILAIASLATAAAIPGPQQSFRSVETDVVLIDALCALAFIALALRADRFWPLWLAALQIGGTASHAVKFIDFEAVPRAYAFMLAIWSYPMIALIVAGTWRHRRRLQRFGADQSWSRPLVAP